MKPAGFLDEPNDTSKASISNRNEGLSTEILFAANQLRRQEQPIYGVTLKQQLLKQTGREYSFGAIYTALMRMQKKGFFSSYLGQPTAKRGGRRKRYYEITEAGLSELRARISSKQSIVEAADDTAFVR